MNIALLVVDMQKAFYNGSSKKSMRNAAEYINYAADLFRRHDKKIIWIQDEDEEDGNIRGTEGFEIIDLLEPGEDEKRIVKRYANGFNKTDLLEYIRRENIDTIIITGYCAEYCVLSTYRGAEDHDLTPIILKGAIASGKEKYKDFVENISEIMSVGVLEKILKESPDGARRNEGEVPDPAKDAPPQGTRENVIALAQQGWTNAEIARSLKLSLGEVALILEMSGEQRPRER